MYKYFFIYTHTLIRIIIRFIVSSGFIKKRGGRSEANPPPLQGEKMRTTIDITPVCLAIHEFRKDKNRPKALVKKEKQLWRGRPGRKNRMDHFTDFWET